VKHEVCMLSQFGTSRAMQMLNRRSSCGGGSTKFSPLSLTHAGGRASNTGAAPQHCWHSVQVWLSQLPEYL
jgi:hypothetical protein